MSSTRTIFTPRARLLATLLLAVTLWVDYLPSAETKQVDPSPVAADRGARQRLEQLDGRPCDLIFIGASNVELFSTTGRQVWDHYYSSRHPLNFGIGGDTTGLALQRLDDPSLRRLRPKVAVVFVGLNNLVETPSQVADGIIAVAGKAKAIFPGVHVIVVSLTPNGRNDASVVQTNRLVRDQAESRDFTYLDLYSHLPRSGNNWIGLRADQLHLNARGYTIWAKQMEPLLEPLLPLDPPHSSIFVSRRDGGN